MVSQKGPMGHMPCAAFDQEWDSSTARPFYLKQNPPSQLPEQVRSAEKEQLYITAAFKTVCSRSDAPWISRELRLLLDELHFGVTKTDSQAAGGGNELRFVYKVEIHVKPASESRWVDNCLFVSYRPNDSNPSEVITTDSTTAGIDISLSAVPSNLFKLSSSVSRSVATKDTRHRFCGKGITTDKSVVWSWMLQYFSDGRRLNAAGKLVPSKRNQLPDLLYPINSESVQLSGDDKVEAIWTVDNDLRASELAFDINLTLYTSVIRQIPLWKFSYNILRLDPTLDHKQHVNWSIVAPISSPSPQLAR